MECKIIPKEYVKPSSPTPRHLKTYKLSLLDQIPLSMPFPVVLHFPSVDDREATLQLLKRSLSVVLSRFYPLSGKAAMDGQYIDCDDSGVPFAVVEFTSDKVAELLVKPDRDLLCQLLPSTDIFGVLPDSKLMMIQVNFDCGGLAIGALFWHRAVDTGAKGSFFRAWSAMARGSSREPVSPNFIVQSLFPSREEFPDQYGWFRDVLKTGKTITRRYVFDASAISSLKAKSGVENPTRVEVVSALIWKCFMAASLANNKSVSLLMHSTNLRHRARPVFPSDCFGNFVALVAGTTTKVGDPKLGHLVKKMREAVSKLDGEFVNEMIGEGGLSRCHENVGWICSDIREGADALLMTSWCGFGLYGIDFGWGMPVWITRPASLETSIFFNGVWLIDSGAGADGIEAWVRLEDIYVGFRQR